jgi:dienelactone hydrolase
MKRTVLALALALTGCTSKKSTPPTPPPPPPKATAPAPATQPARDPVEVGKAFYLHLAKNELDAALAMYDPEIQSKIKTSELADIAKAIGAPGDPTSVDGHALADDGTYVRVEAHYDKGAAADLVLGLKDGWIHRVVVKPYWSPPDYVAPGSFTVLPIVVGSGKTALHGELALPQGASGPSPVVVLIQGSGGGDLDEWSPTITKRLFRDLAYGLASRGVATLRFDKASSMPSFGIAGWDPATFTLQHEYLDPVSWALAVVEKRPEIDPKRVFVLGHSEGGWLIPWFLQDHPELAGGVIASGNARHFAEVPILQNQYLIVVNHPDTHYSDAELGLLRQIDEVKAQKARDPNIADDTPVSELPFGVPAPVWKFMATYDAPQAIAKLDKPVLILQGDRDYNVTAKDDLPLWKKALAGKKDVTVKEYPDLDHAYAAGKGMGLPNDITLPGHVAQPVVDDLVAWVKAH